MRKFLLFSGVFLLGAVAAVIIVFFLVSRYMGPSVQKPSFATSTEAVKAGVKAAASSTLNKVPDSGIPLSKLKLSDQQKVVVKTVGINPDSFVITKAMLACAIDKIGQDRVTAITGGDSPSALETAKLLPCLKP